MQNNHGFTLLELIIAITLLSVIYAIGANYINIQANTDRSQGNCLRANLQNIETVILNYQQSKGDWPDADNSTCSTYPVDFKKNCMPDIIPSYMVASPVTSSCCSWPYSYYLYTKDSSGKVYLCVKAENLNKNQWNALKYILTRLDEDKAYINTACGASSSITPLPDNAPAGTVYLTWWISK